MYPRMIYLLILQLNFYRLVKILMLNQARL
jgi:hypothetical protein